MSWIKLLYPPPTFEIAPGPAWLRALHGSALKIAYYATHSIALLALSFIYFLVILPLKVGAVIKRQDMLSEKIDKNAKSYFQKSEDLALLDFKRMY